MRAQLIMSKRICREYAVLRLRGCSANWMAALSLKHRKRIEEAFGWAKTVGGMAQTVYRGIERVRSRFILTMAANNLVRLPRLLAA